MLKERIFVIPFTIIAGLLIGAGFYFTRDNAPKYDFVLAERGSIYEEVSVTGKIKPAQSVDLAFEETGRISSANVKVGDVVSIGQILASVDNSELLAELSQAEARVKVEQARLDELRRGTRIEEILLQKLKVSNAETALLDAKKNLVDKLRDAYTKSDDGVRNKIDQIFRNPDTASQQIIFTVNDSKVENDTENGRLLAGEILRNWKIELEGLTVESNLRNFINSTKGKLDDIRDFFDNATLSVAYAAVGSGLTQATIDGWRADISAARGNLNTALDNLSSAEENISDAESDLALAKQELILKQAGATGDQLNAAEATVEEANANVENVKARILKTALRSPIRGIVTKQDAKVGEIFQAGSPAISIISAAKFQIEADVSEADIGKIKVGNSARITLDAYGEESFGAGVIAVDPAETIIDGLATYKTTLEFEGDDNRIKSGLTANIDILTAERNGIVVIPQRAVFSKNGGRHVRVLNGDSVRELKVATGIRGADGKIEIVSGLNFGEAVILNPPK
jgi:HlyD family secretion protein